MTPKLSVWSAILFNCTLHCAFKAFLLMRSVKRNCTCLSVAWNCADVSLQSFGPFRLSVDLWSVPNQLQKAVPEQITIITEETPPLFCRQWCHRHSGELEVWEDVLFILYWLWVRAGQRTAGPDSCSSGGVGLRGRHGSHGGEYSQSRFSSAGSGLHQSCKM